jgi:hypothetical protein
MKTVFLRCVLYGIQVSKILSPLTALVLLCEKDGQPLLPAGRYLLSSAFLDASTTWDTITCDEILLNGGDVLNSQPGGTRNGCCGMDGLAGINTFCRIGHPLGTEKSDCWMPHFILIPLIHIHLETQTEVYVTCSPEIFST